jgi:hypothetical protein
MEYVLVFEIAKSGIGELTFVLPGVLFIIVGAGLIRFPDKFDSYGPKWLIHCFFWFAVFWTLSVGLSIYFEQSSLRKNYENGSFDVVEGLVQNFEPMPSGGHKRERFTVNGIKFEYSDFNVTPGFNNTASLGGPIKSGMPVRISHIGNTILKIEVLD